MRTARLKYSCAATLALWLAAPLTSVLHGAFPSHAHHYCAEHQRFEEGEGGAPTHSSGHDKRRGDGHHHGSEHASCPLADLGVLAKALSLAPPPASVLANEASWALPLPAEASSTPSPVSLLVAPKTSPPPV